MLLVAIMITLRVEAIKIQILHTNDLHGYLENTVFDESRGNFSSLKYQIDLMKENAKKDNIESLLLDAGDFLEGNIFYNANRGRMVLQIMDNIGFDAMALGNHDWLMGSHDLNHLLYEIRPKTPILSANMKLYNPLWSSIKKHIKPSHIFEFSNLKVAVIGLSTDEIFYSWRLDGGHMKRPFRPFLKESKKLRKDFDVDAIIALTHLGVQVDKDLVAATKSHELDLVVGGHSHTTLKKPLWAINEDQKQIPIVQTGAHAKYLGRILIELEKGKPLELLDYSLIPINSQGPHEEKVQKKIKEAREVINNFYGEDYLKEVIGSSEIVLESSSYYLTVWSKIVTDAIRESVNADISMHSPGFGGAILPPGPLTREMIFNAYPRVFNWDTKMGWHVYSVDIYGSVLKSLIRASLQTQLPVTFSGVTFDLLDWDDNFVEYGPHEMRRNDDFQLDDDGNILTRFLGIDGPFRVDNIKCAGEKISPYRLYRVAMPEGFVIGGLGITSALKLLLRSVSKTETSLWEAIMKKVQKEKVITENYLGDAREFISSQFPLERDVIKKRPE